MPRIARISGSVLLTVLVASAGILAPRASHADDCSMDAECAMRQVIGSFPTDFRWNLHGSLSTDGRATSDGDQRLAALGAGLDVAYASNECRWIGAAVDVEGYADRETRHLSESEELTFCLPIPHLPELTLRRQRELIPRLSAAPYFRASRYGTTGFDLRTRMLRFELESMDLRIGYSSLAASMLSQEVDGAIERTDEFDVSMGIVQMAWPDRGFLGDERVLDLMLARVLVRGSGETDENGMSPQATAIAFSFFRFTGVGNGRRSLDLDLGMAMGYFSDVGPSTMNPDGTIEQNIDAGIGVATVHANVHYMWGDGRAAQGIQYQHTLAPSSYSTLVAENRLSVWARRGDEKNTTTVRGFAALTQIVDEEADVERVATGGLAVSRDMRVGDHFHLGLTGEAARSFYANLHGTSAVEVGWAARLQAEIAFQAQSRD